MLLFCLILTAIFMTMIATTTNILNHQFDRVQDDYHRAQALAAAEAGMAHAHVVVETAKVPLDVTLAYGTRYRVAFNMCSTLGNKRLWTITSTGWSINRHMAWSIQQKVIETLPGGMCQAVQGSLTLSDGGLLSSGCP